MAISLAQDIKSQAINSSATTIAVPAFDSNVTAGNVLAVVVQSENSGPSISISDTQGNTWTELVSRAGNPPFSPDNTAKVAIFWTTAGSSGAITITATFGIAVYRAITGMELAGFSSPQAGGTNSGIGTSSVPDAGAVTTTNANNIVLYGVEGSWGTALTPPTNFVEELDATNYFQPYSAYQLNASVGSVGTAGGTSTGAWIAVAAIIEEGGGAGSILPLVACDMANVRDTGGMRG